MVVLPLVSEPGVRPGRQDDLPSLATKLTDEAAKLVADPKSTLDHIKERQSITLAVDTTNDSRSLKYGKWKKRSPTFFNSSSIFSLVVHVVTNLS